jgi:hypothetical protein
MRSSSEIAEEINALKAQIASGLPYGNSEAHNAAVFDHVYSGDRSGVDAFQRAIEQAMQNKLQRELTASENEQNRQNALKIAEMGKAEAIAERKQKADELAALKLAQARPEYLKLQKQMLDAVDAGNLDEAAIIKSQMEALEAEHGVKFGADAQGLIDARDAARIARQEKQAAEGARRLSVAKFLADLPTTFKNEEAKKPVYAAINDNTAMTPEEKAKEIERIRNIESGRTKVKKAVEGAVASGAGDDVKKNKEEREKGIALARKAKQKKDSGRLLMTDEQEALDKWGGEL